MIEPPRQFWRIRIFEVHDGIFIAIEDVVFKRVRRLMGHPRVVKVGFGVYALAIETGKNSCRRGPIETFVVETNSNFQSLLLLWLDEPDPKVESQPRWTLASSLSIGKETANNVGEEKSSRRDTRHSDAGRPRRRGDAFPSCDLRFAKNLIGEVRSDGDAVFFALVSLDHEQYP